MPQKRTQILFGIACFLLVAVLVLTIQSKEISFSRGKLSFPSQQVTIKVDIAVSKPQLEKGLMFRENLDNNQGMLLIFEYEKKMQIWMKNMLMPLDIVFISAQNQVVSLLRNIPPCLPSPCIIYEPQIPSKMVLELNTGKIDQYNIKIGDKVSLLVY